MNTKDLNSEYAVEVDRVTKEEWSGLLGGFEDGNIYQTWSYGAVRWGESNLSHLVLRRNGIAVAIAQSRIKRIPGLGMGIVYLFRGPLWRLQGIERNPVIFRQIIHALRETYVVKKGLFLRVLPNEIEDGSDTIVSILSNEHFRRVSSIIGNRTIFMSILQSLEELRRGLRRKWRQTLGYAEKSGLETIWGTSEELYEVALNIYNEMHARKKFTEFVNMNEFKAIQRDLPDGLKIRVMICKFKNEPVAALAWSAIGNTGLPVLAATGNKGLETNASYLLWWKMIEWLKTHNYAWCDFGGIDPDKNPGGYIFKSGVAGKYGKEVRFIDQFDACETPMNSALIACSDVLRLTWRKAKVTINKMENRARLAFKSRGAGGKKNVEGTVR
jgi:hypothetical protein